MHSTHKGLILTGVGSGVDTREARVTAVLLHCQRVVYTAPHHGRSRCRHQINDKCRPICPSALTRPYSRLKVLSHRIRHGMVRHRTAPYGAARRRMRCRAVRCGAMCRAGTWIRWSSDAASVTRVTMDFLILLLNNNHFNIAKTHRSTNNTHAI